LHLVGFLLTLNYDARNHELQKRKNILLVLTEFVASETVTVRGEDNVLRVLDNKKLRRIFGPSGEKAKGGRKTTRYATF